MKWSYTNGKLNVSSEDIDQQFTLQELIEEVTAWHHDRRATDHIAIVQDSAILSKGAELRYDVLTVQDNLRWTNSREVL